MTIKTIPNNISKLLENYVNSSKKPNTSRLPETSKVQGTGNMEKLWKERNPVGQRFDKKV